MKERMRGKRARGSIKNDRRMVSEDRFCKVKVIGKMLSRTKMRGNEKESAGESE